MLLDASGRAKLADLGLARDESAEVTALTGEGVMVGTPHYMSPEMIDGDSSIDLRSDFYSAGVMLYELLTRSKPFPAKNLEQLYDQHLYMDPAPITELRGDVPTELALLIHQLLSKTPGERPAKTDDILRLLRELSESNAGASFGDSSVLNPASLKARAESQESSAEQPRPKDTASFLLRITGPKGQTRCVFLKAGKSLSLGRLVSTGASVDLGLAVNRCNAGEETRRISRRHAEFQIDQGQVRVLDLGSTAGSFLNDQRLLPGEAVPFQSRGVFSIARVIDYKILSLTQQAGDKDPNILGFGCSEGAPVDFILMPRAVELEFFEEILGPSRHGAIRFQARDGSIVFNLPGMTETRLTQGGRWQRGEYAIQAFGPTELSAALMQNSGRQSDADFFMGSGDEP